MKYHCFLTYVNGYQYSPVESRESLINMIEITYLLTQNASAISFSFYITLLRLFCYTGKTNLEDTKKQTKLLRVKHNCMRKVDATL